MTFSQRQVSEEVQDLRKFGSTLVRGKRNPRRRRRRGDRRLAAKDRKEVGNAAETETETATDTPWSLQRFVFALSRATRVDEPPLSGRLRVPAGTVTRNFPSARAALSRRKFVARAVRSFDTRRRKVR